MSILEKINDSNDIKNLEPAELAPLCDELRAFLIESISRTGGHLASNLGAIELTVAIHRVFDTSGDRLIFDVGHQCYTHKILTGRRGRFDTLRKLDGIAGFPKPSESIHDAFIAGHASNSVSVALGMARARTIKNENYSIIAVMGDGALTGGALYEALNDAGQSGEPLVVVLNDNGMSITKNVGGIAEHLARLRIKPQYFKFKRIYHKFMSIIPGGKSIYNFIHGIKTAIKDLFFQSSLFENMGFTYLGPADGNDVGQVAYLLERAKLLACPVLVHLNTTKGKGYKYSEENPDEYHGISSFDIDSGISCSGKASFSSEFGDYLTKLAEKNHNICAITAAMQNGTGLDVFSKTYPQRFFDVGIAEQHAAALAAGMAKQGLIPVFAVYSTFLQRAYDMLIHDVAIQKLHTVFAVDRAGLVGEDGETHQGIFDAAYLSQIPDMTVLCPSNYTELRSMLYAAVELEQGPVAVRFPRGSEGLFKDDTSEKSSCIIRGGTDITLVTYGIMINNALTAANILKASDISSEIIKVNKLNPPEFDLILDSVRKTGVLTVVEDSISEGGLGQRLAALLAQNEINAKVILKNLGQTFVQHGSIAELQKIYGLDSDSIAVSIKKVLLK